MAETYGFSREDHRRVSAAVKRVERSYQNKPGKKGAPVPPLAGIWPAEASGGTPAGSPTSPETGSAILKYPTSASDAALTVNGPTVTFVSHIAAAIVDKQLLFLSPWNGGWLLIQASCGAAFS